MAYTVVENTGDQQKTLSVAILVAGAPPKEVLEKYGGFEFMFRNGLAEAMANIPRHKWHPKVFLHLQAFNVLEAEFPDISQLDDGLWDAVIVTGSAASATTENVLWMDVLSKYLQHLVLEHPLVRLIGVGFGHQLIARTFGAKITHDLDHAEVCNLRSDASSSALPNSNSLLKVQRFCRHSTRRQNGYVSSLT